MSSAVVTTYCLLNPVLKKRSQMLISHSWHFVTKFMVVFSSLSIYLHTLQAVLGSSLLFFQLQFVPIKCMCANLSATNWTSMLPALVLHSQTPSSRDKTKTELAVLPNCQHQLLHISCPTKRTLLLNIPCPGNPFHCYFSSKSRWNIFGVQKLLS